MSEYADPFDPALKPAMSAGLYRKAHARNPDMASLYRALLLESENPELHPLAFRFVEERLASSARPNKIDLPKAWGRDEWLLSLPADAPLPDSSSFALDRLREGLCLVYPILSTEPCWLQNILQTATNQAPLALQLSRLYVQATLTNRPDTAFQALVAAYGPDTTDSRSMGLQASAMPFYALAALQLALARLPRVYFPEILGFTLAWTQTRSLLEGFEATGHFAVLNHLENRRLRCAAAEPLITAAIRDYLARFAGLEAELRPRIAAGFLLYREAVHACEERLQQLALPVSPLQTAARLCAEKASAAIGHHRKIKLEGRTLDDWFAVRPFDGEGFLKALRNSGYVDRNNPAASRLLKLFEFEGPMFGVLNETEYAGLKRWLIEGDENAETAAESRLEPVFESGRLAGDRGSAVPDFTRMRRRELYHYLVHADLYPEISTAARQAVDRVLRRARLFGRLPFTAYTAAALDAFVEGLYRRETAAYEPLAEKPRLSRQAYLWGIEQMAPAILTDGCWLQSAGRLRNAPHAAIGVSLYKIYDDENGNGLDAQNHPAIYRRLLESQNLNLPPIHDPAFCNHPGFIDSAFDLPVYLMAISQFPVTLLPELLGLNLAIELSGLGRVYLRLAQELRYWGIDPKIVSVHLSIDNLASGHAALAKHAIGDYLDGILAGQGEAARDAHWRRVYRGYASLAAAVGPFKLAMAARYLSGQFKSRPTGQRRPLRRSDQNA